MKRTHMSSLRQRARLELLGLASVATLALGCLVEADGLSADDQTTVTVEAALGGLGDPVACDTLPRIPRQQLAHVARELMDGEVITDLQFPAYPPLGVWVHEIFIKDREVPLAVLSSFLVAIGIPPFLVSLVQVSGDGDGHEDGSPRDHEVSFDPRNVRAFIVLDFERGQGYLLSNNSMLVARGPGDFSLSYTFEARPVPHVWMGEDHDFGADSWVYAEWVNADTFRVRYHLLENIWFSDVAAAASDAIAPIDAQFEIDRWGGYDLTADRFPSYGTYHYPPCSSYPVSRFLAHQHELSDLGADANFPHAAPVGASPAAPEGLGFLEHGLFVTPGCGLIADMFDAGNTGHADSYAEGSQCSNTHVLVATDLFGSIVTATDTGSSSHGGGAGPGQVLKYGLYAEQWGNPFGSNHSVVGFDGECHWRGDIHLDCFGGIQSSTTLLGCPAPGHGGPPVDAAVCDAPLVQCGGACANLNSDPMNCGACGNTCAGGACAGGVCGGPG